MNRVVVHIRNILILILSLVIGLLSLNSNSARAQSVPLVESTDPVFLITELKVSPSPEEFIEFTNNTNQELEISTVKLEYHSDSSPNYSNKTLSLKKTLPLAMPAGAKLQLSSSTSVWANNSLATFSAGLKDSIGWIKISVTVNNVIYSSYAHWGQKDEPECTTSPVPSSTQSLKRFIDNDMTYLLSQKSGEDYFLSSMPTPMDNMNPEPLNPDEIEDYCNKPIPAPPTEPSPTNTGNPTPNTTTTTQPAINTDPTTTQPAPTAVEPSKNYLPIQISEVLPDPVSPQNDAEDEYIEIYNPNQQTVDLTGYQLQSGNSFSYKYIFNGVELGPGQYLVIYRKDSGLTLANTSGSARVLDPAGNVLDQTSYDNPEPGVSWSKLNGSWMYTSSPTPGGANAFAAILTKTSKTSSKSAATKTTTNKKVTTKKVAAKKAPSNKTSSKKTKTANIVSSSQNPKDDPTTKLDSKYIYIAIALLAIYNLWEYRDSIKRFLLKPIAKRKLKFSSSG